MKSLRRRLVSLAATAVVGGSLVGVTSVPGTAVASSGSSVAASTSLLLDECDPGGYVPCNQLAAFLSVPIVGTGLALTYSSQWAPARSDRPDWDVSNLGLGGWSVNVLENYDTGQGILVSGDGTWRFAREVPAGPGEYAVPSYDGTLAYVFNSAGQQVRTVDGHLGTTLLNLAYGSAGRLSKISGTVNGVPANLTVRREANGTPTALLGTDGAVTSLTFDQSGNLVSLRGPAGTTTRFTWQPGGLVTAETDPTGAVTHFRYGAGGLLTAETDPDAVTQRLSRSATSTAVEVRVVGELGRVSTYATKLSGSGIRRTYTAPGGATTTETTQSDGSFSLSLPDGTTSIVGAVASSVWGLSAPVLTPIVTTVPHGPTSRTETKQHLSEVNGLPYMVTGTVTTTVNGDRSVESFDPSTRTTTVVDAAGGTTINTYGSSGLLIAASAPGRAPVTYAYDSKGLLVRETAGSGRLAETTRWAYDASTGTVKMTRPDGSRITEEVDAQDNPTAVTGPNGATIIETYNADGLLTEVQPPGGSTYTLGYSAAGRPTAFLAPSVSKRTSIETASYDRDGDLKSLSGLGNKPITLTYDAAGEETRMSFDQGTATASYNTKTGLLSQAKDPDGVSTTFGYSGGLIDKLSWSGPLRGSVTDNYDANGLPSSETVDGGPAIRFAYDGAENLTAVGPLSLNRNATTGLVTGSTLGLVHTAYDYFANDLLREATATVGNHTVMELRYSRDALGRVSSVVESGPAGSTTTDYKYNSADLLSQVIVNGRTVESDSYDDAGNRTAQTTPAGKTSATYNADDELLKWGNTSYSWASDGTLARVTDGAGTTSYTFDDLGRLRHVSLPTGESITYLVDAAGERVGREVDGRLVAGYLYDPSGNVVAETDGAGAVIARYGYDQRGHLALVQERGNTYDVITDPNGSPLLVVNSKSGATADSIIYNPWGEITSETAPGMIPFGFDGGLVDPVTGLVHLGARDYDPATGRWTGPDPIGFAGGDADLYRFAGDDPVNNTDPTGLYYPPIVLPPDTIYGSPSPATAYPPIELPPATIYGSPSPTTSSPSTSPSEGPHFPEDCLLCNGYGFDFPNPGDFIGDFFKPLPGGDEVPENCLLCNGYGSWGDTHLTTGGKLHYNFQAAGEFTAIKSPDGSIDVQVRQQPSKGGTWVTFATAVAANVDGDRVGVYALEPWFLRVNGAVAEGALFSERLPHGGTVARNGSSVTVRWPDGSELAVTLEDDNNLSYDFIPGPGVAPTLTGILGTDNTEVQLVDGNGSNLLWSDPKFQKKFYSQFANSWRISQAESLFDYGPGESTATFTNLSIPYANYTVASLSASARASAGAICAALGVRSEPLLDDCILDVGVTGDPGLAAAEAQVAATGTSATAVGTTTQITTKTTQTTGTTTTTTAPPTTAPPTTSPLTTGHGLALGATVSGTIKSASQQEAYTFNATAGETVYLESKLQKCEASPPWWQLLGPNGLVDGDLPVCSDIGRVVLDKAGTWTVDVFSRGGSTGSYAFTVLAVPATTTTPIAVAQTVSGSISHIGQERDYTFTATPGETVYLESKLQKCEANTPWWQLLGPDGSEDGYGTACQDIGRVVLTSAGTWTVNVFSRGGSTGPYAFTVLSVPATTTTQITIGELVAGSISRGQERDYTFTATAGETVYLESKLQKCDANPPWWQLVEPDGSDDGYGTACQDIGRVVLTSAGTWTVNVFSRGSSAGPYAFVVSRSEK
jgi:RHS repeat-associated protein